MIGVVAMFVAAASAADVPPVSCPDGQVSNSATEWHCCASGQVWKGDRCSGAAAPAAPTAQSGARPRADLQPVDDIGPGFVEAAHKKRLESMILLEQLSAQNAVSGDQRAEMKLRTADLDFQEARYVRGRGASEIGRAHV